MGRAAPLTACLLLLLARAAAGADFCADAQRVLTGTGLPVTNELNPDLPAFIRSKPFIGPLTTQELHTGGPDGVQMISCKLLTRANLELVYGTGSADRNLDCRSVNAVTLAAVTAELPPGQALAFGPASVRLEEDLVAPLGPVWLNTPQRVWVADGVLHVQASAVYADLDDPALRSAPASVKGTRNCHLIAPGYLRRLMTGDAAPAAD